MSENLSGGQPAKRRRIVRNRAAAPVPMPLLDEKGQAEAWLTRCIARGKAVGYYGEVFTITPPMAEVLLARNPSNRAVVATGVRHWAQALRAGHWEVNGEPIIVAVTGELNDGQHRLTAVVETGISMTTFVVFGVSRDSRKTVDIGKKRTAGHILGMAGVTNAALVASTAKLHINLRCAAHLHVHRSPQEIEREIEMFPDLLTHRGTSYRFARQFHQSTGLMAVLHCMAWRLHAEQADVFFDMLDTGVGLFDKCHPAYVLRKRLMDNLGGKARLPITEVAALTIKAWNAFAQGRQVRALRWIAEGDTPESFPVLR